MKKLAIVGIFVFALVFIVSPSVASAVTLAELQAQLSGLYAKLGQLSQEQPAAVVSSIDSRMAKIIRPTLPTAISTPDSPSNSCAQSQVPAGRKDETIRCDGGNGKWVATKNMLNNGLNLGIGAEPFPAIAGYNGSRLFVQANHQYDSAIQGWATQYGYAIIGQSNQGTGVYGDSIGNYGVGVMGYAPYGTATYGQTETGTAVRADVYGPGYGFYQGGEGTKNNFEGTLTVGYVNAGATAPGVKVQVNGGIKFATNQAAPTCTTTTQGTFWFVKGPAGVKDTVQVCAKDAAGTFAWRVIY